MVRIRNLLIFMLLFYSGNDLLAQLIRKDHSEMTPSEKRTYRDAVISLKNFMLAHAVHHADFFNTEIHTRASPINGSQFLSWHRLFMLEVEDQLRTSGISNADKITIPYWNWTIENSSSNVTWGNTGFLDLPTLQNAGFIADNDGDPNTPKNAIIRSISPSPFVQSSDLTDMNGLSSFMPSFWQNPNNGLSSFFSKRLERHHNQGHGFIGGTMNSFESPADPVFYLHHNFVDKLWQDWEDKESSIKSSFPTPPSTPLNINDWPNTSPNSITDARRMV